MAKENVKEKELDNFVEWFKKHSIPYKEIHVMKQANGLYSVKWCYKI